MVKRITIEIDEALLEQAKRALGCRTIRGTAVTKMDKGGVARDDLATVLWDAPVSFYRLMPDPQDQIASTLDRAASTNALAWRTHDAASLREMSRDSYAACVLRSMQRLRVFASLGST